MSAGVPPGPGSPREPLEPLEPRESRKEGGDEDGQLPGPGPEARRQAGHIALAGFLLYPLVVAGFALRWDMALLDALFLAALLELLPALSVAQVPLTEGGRVERLPAYVGSALTILGLGAAGLALGVRGGGGEAMGLGPLPWDALATWTVGLLGGAALITGGFHLLERLTGLGDSPLLEQLLPRTARERRAFVGLSFAAGLGEELAFRAYAIPTLAPVVGGGWAAAAFTSLAFGVLHAYQGPLGIVRTALLGGLLAASLLLSGSLWPAVVAHTVVDLVGGLWLGPRLLRGDDTRGDVARPGGEEGRG